MYKITSFLELNYTLAKDYLLAFEYPWQAIKGIRELILSLGPKLGNSYIEVKKDVWVHESVAVADSAYLGSPLIVGEGSEIRQSAFIRGSAIIGKNVVIGNSVEVKNAIIFDNAEIPHFNYVGDSILGYKAHMGAGAITSNIKADRKLISINGIEKIETGLRKFGAIIGDYVEIGCNCVLNPGTIIGRNTTIYPLSSVRGVIPEMSIYKDRNHIIKKEER